MSQETPQQNLNELVKSIEAPDQITAATSAELTRIGSSLGPLVERVSGYRVEIDSDPVAHGLRQFNEKLALIRHYANEAADHLKVATAERNKARLRRDSARRAYENKLTRLLALDEEIAKISGQEARKHASQQRLERELLIVHATEQVYQAVCTYHEALKITFDNLRATKDDLMSQLAVIKQQITLGEVHLNQFPIPGSGQPTSRLEEAERAVAAEVPHPGHHQF